MDEDIAGGSRNVVDTAGTGGGSSSTAVAARPPPPTSSGNTMAAFSAAAVQALAPGLFDSPMVNILFDCTNKRYLDI